MVEMNDIIICAFDEEVDKDEEVLFDLFFMKFDHCIYNHMRIAMCPPDKKWMRMQTFAQIRTFKISSTFINHNV